jgi:hypothetical protein
MAFMSDTNGVFTPKKKKRRIAKVAANPTGNYLPVATSWWGWPTSILDNSPWFTWFDIPRMLRDPQVRFLERMWRAPFQRVKWVVKSEDPRISAFADSTLRRFWRKSTPKLWSRYFRFGYAPGGAEFAIRKNSLRLEQVRMIEPRDARPLKWARGPEMGKPAGFALQANGSGTPWAPPESETNRGQWVPPGNAMWFAGYGEFGAWFDVPPLAGMFEPWAEKRGRGGAIQSRRLYARTAAFTGGEIYHPEGVTNLGTDENPRMMNNQDIARSTLEYGENGSVYTFFSDHIPDTNLRQWEFKRATAGPVNPSIFEYPKDLDGEMSTAIGIPKEVLEASEVGSGWSGRLIPLMGFLGGVDELAGMMIESADSGWLRNLVHVNFGPKVWYEIEPLSLAEEVQTQAKAGKGGGEGDNPIPGMFGAGQQQARARTMSRVRGIDLSVTHAPEGGVMIAGNWYPGGRFIPSEVLEKASPAEKAKLGSKDADVSPEDGKVAQILRTLRNLPKKAVKKARKKVKDTYGKLEGRYGPGYARVIVGAGVAGLPVPLPGASVAFAAPVLAIAELHRQLKKWNAPPPEEIDVDGIVKPAARWFLGRCLGSLRSALHLSYLGEIEEELPELLLWAEELSAADPELADQQNQEKEAIPLPQPEHVAEAYRGVRAGENPRSTEKAVGNGLFYSPHETVAHAYSRGPEGDLGTVVKDRLAFKNLLAANTWNEAKQKLGLPQATSMRDLIAAAAKNGHDGLSFRTGHGLEYVALPGHLSEPLPYEPPAMAKPVAKEPEGPAVAGWDTLSVTELPTRESVREDPPDDVKETETPSVESKPNANFSLGESQLEPSKAKPPTLELPHFFGNEKVRAREGLPANKSAAEGTSDLVHHIMGGETPEHSHQQLAELLGLPDETKLRVIHAGNHNDDEHPVPGAKGVRVSGVHPNFGDIRRFVGVTPEGKKFLNNEILEVNPSEQKKGIGTGILARQVEAAVRHGFDHITAHAAGKKGGKFIGYYTWPLLGYDQSLTDSSIGKDLQNQYNEARKAFPEAKTVQDIFTTPEGRKWWKENGPELPNARFDLRPESRSISRLRKYLEERQATRNARKPISPTTNSLPQSELATSLSSTSDPPEPRGIPGIIHEWATATGRPKEHLATGLWNAGIDDPAAGIPADYQHDPRKLARRMVSEWLDLHGSAGTPEELEPLERALAHAGLQKKHEVGDEVPFDGLYHAGPSGLFTGDAARVVRPGWTLPEPEGREYVVAKSGVVKGQGK